MRAARFARSVVLWGIFCSLPVCEAGARDAGDGPIPTRQQLVGAWRLVHIDVSGPSGPLVDPFYQPESEGIIVYDLSGWMSVQIAAPHRPAFEVPASRSPSAASGPLSRRKAAAFDTYYSYYGTWDFDEVTGVVTHHVKSSLIPAETGLSYAQNVTLEGARLTFTTRDRTHGKEIIRRKVWERITGTGQ
ncbi:MAG: lipocalin-like domain-containing protein [Steroidobacteraceae bacterium]|jgi:hypothetical protein